MKIKDIGKSYRVIPYNQNLLINMMRQFTGGVTTMPSFLETFFPSVAKQAAEAKNTNMYCMYDSHALTLFTSSLYIAGLVASPVASRLIATTGRKKVMLLGGCIFFAGAALNGLAANVLMLILGRLMLGFGVGFNNQVGYIFPILSHIELKIMLKKPSNIIEPTLTHDN